MGPLLGDPAVGEDDDRRGVEGARVIAEEQEGGPGDQGAGQGQPRTLAAEAGVAALAARRLQAERPRIDESPRTGQGLRAILMRSWDTTSDGFWNPESLRLGIDRPPQDRTPSAGSSIKTSRSKSHTSGRSRAGVPRRGPCGKTRKRDRARPPRPPAGPNRRN